MAESITEGTLTQFTKQVGDFIEQDEELATIETYKVDVSVNAPHSGAISRLLVVDGETVTIDQAIAELQPQKGSSASEKKEAIQEPPEPTSERSVPKTNEPGHSVPPPSMAQRPEQPEGMLLE